eukprot:PhM_4_TR13942/c5_g2_i1/m.5368/K03013/RPB5, POLR2E; DNA-directed RNA polymerases I, II, and III subunit RPABC1
MCGVCVFLLSLKLVRCCVGVLCFFKLFISIILHKQQLSSLSLSHSVFYQNNIKMSTMTPSSRLYRVMRTVGEMLTERGYHIPDSLIPDSLEKFEHKFCPTGPGTTPNRRDMTLNVSRPANAEDSILVFFMEEPKVGAGEIKELVAVATSQNARVAILVYTQDMTPIGRRVITQINQTDQVRIEPFTEDELTVNITKHELVPRHVPLSATEKKEVLDTFRLKESQLPRMSHTDPMARFLGLTRGRVVKIIRPSETAGQYVMYRLVV